MTKILLSISFLFPVITFSGEKSAHDMYGEFVRSYYETVAQLEKEMNTAADDLKADPKLMKDQSFINGVSLSLLRLTYEADQKIRTFVETCVVDDNAVARDLQYKREILKALNNSVFSEGFVFVNESWEDIYGRSKDLWGNEYNYRRVFFYGDMQIAHLELNLENNFLLEQSSAEKWLFRTVSLPSRILVGSARMKKQSAQTSQAKWPISVVLRRMGHPEGTAFLIR
jgi:hypothetical protein